MGRTDEPSDLDPETDLGLEMGWETALGADSARMSPTQTTDQPPHHP